MCQQVDEQAEAEGLRTTVPLSPGLVGWPVASGQRQLFALVDAASAGVSLTEGYMMVPKKSTSLAIGIGPGRGARRRVLRLLQHGRDLPLPPRAHLPPWLRPIPQRLSAWSCSRWAGECE